MWKDELKDLVVKIKIWLLWIVVVWWYGGVWKCKYYFFFGLIYKFLFWYVFFWYNYEVFLIKDFKVRYNE